MLATLDRERILKGPMTKRTLLLQPYSLEEYRERLLVNKNTAQVKAWLEGSWDMSESHLCPRREESNVVFKLPESDEWREDGTCSYCGSMNPTEFMKQTTEGIELGPTDKSYKVYVGKAQKFYFMHLTEDQKQRFVVLLNTQQLNIAYPGHFYVLPYFIGRTH